MPAVKIQTVGTGGNSASVETMNMQASALRAEIEEAMLEAYGGYYDVERIENSDVFCTAIATYNNFMEKYVLTRKARIWAAHAHEFIFVFSLEHLDMQRWEAIKAYFMKEGFARMQVDNMHMYTYISPLLLADEIDGDVCKNMKRFKFYKSFRLSFYGWTTARLAALEMSSGKIISNYQGRDAGRFVNKIYKEKTK